MASSSGSNQPVTWTEYSEPRCCQCSQQSHCNRDEYCACHSKHVHCTNCFADSCTNRNILLGPAVEVHVPLCHHPPPQVNHGTLPTHPPPQVSRGTLPAHLLQEVGSSQRRAPLPPPSLAYDDISSWNRVVQSAPLRSSFNTSRNQATPSPHQPMLVSHSGGQTDYLSYSSSRATVSGGLVSSPSPTHVNPSWNQPRSHTTPAVSHSVLARAPSVQATHLQPSSSQVSASPNQDTPLTSKVSAVTSSDHRETLVSPLSSHIILSGKLTFPQSATPALSSGDKQGDASVHDAQFVSSDAAITGASTQQLDKSITSSPASQASGGSRCCPCNWKSKCMVTRYCPCRTKEVRCTSCLSERCSNRDIVQTSKKDRCCECTDTSQCSKTRSCSCLSRSILCANCVAEKCSNRCCPCDEESDCTKNDNCDCRIKDRRCFEGCRATCCTNYKTTTALTECCQCNEESDCNSNNCACHSRHTRCSANCFAGGCTNNKRIGECKECCQCIEGSKCESENCECRSDESPCSCGCLASGCVKQIPRHNTVMGQTVDPHISKKRIQRIVKRQTMSNTQRDASSTSDDERKVIRPTPQDTAHTSSIPASHQGPEPANVTEFLNAWFPRLDTQPYIIPPVHFDTVNVQTVNLAGGHSIKVLKTQEERVQGQNKRVNRTVKIDKILKKIHYCLSHIKKEAARQGELMVIMSQAKCGPYGADSRSLYTGAVAMNTDSKDTRALDFRDECFDLLVIHRQHGVMMVTIRTTEENPETLQEDIRKAVDYLEKAKQVVEDRVVHDVTPKPAIHRAVLLPNVTRDCLQGQLVKISDLSELEQRLGVEHGSSFSKFCLCADDMADETSVKRWWTTCLKRDAGADRLMMGQDVYRQLVTK